ncbi:hypothetical protein quinque_000962 [Culex quinquefasciatus]
MSSTTDPQTPASHLPRLLPIEIAFRKLSYGAYEGKRHLHLHRTHTKLILRSVSGTFCASELSAIMGPSGAGKSTLMNVLAGYKTSNVAGKIYINGKRRRLDRFRRLSCYILQDDRLLPYLSVREAMMYSASLRLGAKVPIELKRNIVEEIVDTLGLLHVADNLSCELSGGQRKRLSIALELVNNPPVMFLDEPTSGLDSATCSQLIHLLKTLAREGRTIVCTIHQPSARIFEMFDHLFMLAEGQCIYRGVVDGLVPFLSGQGLMCPSFHNPADFVMEVACGEHGDWIDNLVTAVHEGKCEEYEQREPLGNGIAVLQLDSDDDHPQTDEFVTIELPSVSSGHAVSPSDTNGFGDTSLREQASTSKRLSLVESMESISPVRMKHYKGFATSRWRQFWILLKRTVRTSLRDTALTQMRVVSHVVVGLLIGCFYYDIGRDASKIIDNAGCIFFTLLFTMFTAMMPTILTFPLEFGVLEKEHLNYWYSLESFYLARTAADVPFQIFFTTVYVAIVYSLSSQPMELKRAALFTMICVLNSLVAQSFGLLVGAGLRVQTGVFLGPVSAIPVILFSGFFLRLDLIPKYLRWCSYVSYLRYGFEGAIVALYGFDRVAMPCSRSFSCHYPSPKEFLKEMSMDKAEYWIDATALLGFFVVIRVAAYFVLRFKLLSNR